MNPTKTVYLLLGVKGTCVVPLMEVHHPGLQTSKDKVMLLWCTEHLDAL